MSGDVKIGGGHSSFVYAFVGEAKDKNSRKHTAIFDDSDPTPIEIYKCKKGEKTPAGKPIDQLTVDELDAGMFYLIHWK